MKLKLTANICCEECSEIYGYSIDCPVCGKEEGYTDIGDDLAYAIKYDPVFSCECGAKYKIIGESFWEKLYHYINVEQLSETN